MVVQSFFLVSFIKSHKNEVHSEFNEHFNKNIFIDLAISDYQKNTRSITWLEKDEIMINDYFFDILKVEKLQNNLIRLYIFCDMKDVSLTDLLCKEHGLKQKAAKKNKRSTISNLLKLKTYIPSALNWFVQSRSIAYHSQDEKLISNFHSKIEHPPTI